MDKLKICVVCRQEFAWEVQECPFDKVRLTERDTLIGTVFDEKYEILDFIGLGGLSRVYKSRHIGLNRVLALKVLKSAELIDIQRFRQEAIAVSHLNHPNIARIYSFAVAPNAKPYMALEYLEGKDASEWVAQYGKFSVSLSVFVFLQVASALAHAHKHGILHRDIKPGNIMLLGEKEDVFEAKVLDFGMAKIINDEISNKQIITGDFEIVGTKEYISPELYEGKKPDFRSDIYSLGKTMQETTNLSNNSQALSKLINKAISLNPADRFQTADEFVQELLQVESLEEQYVYKGKNLSEGYDYRFNSNEKIGFWSRDSWILIINSISLLILMLIITLFIYKQYYFEANKILEIFR